MRAVHEGGAVVRRGGRIELQVPGARGGAGARRAAMATVDTPVGGVRPESGTPALIAFKVGAVGLDGRGYRLARRRGRRRGRAHGRGEGRPSRHTDHQRAFIFRAGRHRGSFPIISSNCVILAPSSVCVQKRGPEVIASSRFHVVAFRSVMPKLGVGGRSGRNKAARFLPISAALYRPMPLPFCSSPREWKTASTFVRLWLSTTPSMGCAWTKDFGLSSGYVRIVHISRDTRVRAVQTSASVSASLPSGE
jgi:hypothetical protein